MSARIGSRWTVALAAATGLAVTAALAPAASASAAPSASVTCDGHHSGTISPGLTDEPKEQTTEAKLVFGEDDPAKGSTCESSDTGITGATLKETIKHEVSCFETEPVQGTITGTIEWKNGKSSKLGDDAKFLIDDQQHGDSLIKQSATIADGGEFAGHTVIISVHGETPDPKLCEGAGVTSVSGEASLAVEP